MIGGKLHDIGNYVMDIKMVFKSTEKKTKTRQGKLSNQKVSAQPRKPSTE